MKDTYLILSGTSKAATTSVFNYLADHPNVCESSIKQTNYFLDSETQSTLGLYSTYQYSNDMVNYKNYFSCQESQPFKLEATPDYMYYNESANRLKAFTKAHKTKLIFILRDPVSRFKSWYSFGKQQGDLPESTSFSDFYTQSKNYKGNSSPSLMAYQTGFYSKYLIKFFRDFDSENIEVFFYEELIENPSNFIINFSKRVGLDSTFYNHYDFKHYNKTVKTRSKSINVIYNALRSFYIKYLFKGKVGVKFGQVLKSIFSPLYKKLNTQKLTPKSIDDTVIMQLEADYKQEKQEILKLIGKTPWI
ncbi:sulfotransferase domain-containing protein [Lacinutrix salivirga]